MMLSFPKKIICMPIDQNQNCVISFSEDIHIWGKLSILGPKMIALFFLVFKLKFIFMCLPPLGLFWSAKYLNFWAKATDLDKIYIMFCLPIRAKYPFFKAPAHGL